ncbi:MAG: hypothetical protein J7K98_00115 [Candidatus Aenigmarchaeota archaeon]|nr:hypothetical protein [Candidatus Aenigmarchaeota archaeon]
MEVVFQLLDADYIFVDDKPIIRLFGRTENGKSVCLFYSRFKPYFYIHVKEGKEMEVLNFLKQNFSSEIVRFDWVFRYLPLGYQKEKTRLLKVTLKNPSKVPNIREALKKNKNVINTYEADILFKYRFMVDYNLFGMRWYRAKVTPANTNTVDVDLKFDATSFEEVDMDKDAEMKYLSFDIEVVPGEKGLPDPKKDPIIIISMAFHPEYKRKKKLVLTSKRVRVSNNDLLTFDTEKEMLKKFIGIIKDFDPDVLTGYNIENFDIPYIIERLKANKLSRALGRCKQKPITSKKVGTRYRSSVIGRAIADVYILIKEAVGKGLLRLKRYGLGDVAMELLGEGKVDISHSEISKYWNGDSTAVQKLLEYAAKDSELALRLLIEKQMLDKFIGICKVSGVLLQDALEISESIRIENLLLREFNKRGFVIPNKPDEEEVKRRKEERKKSGLKGALVLQPEVGLHNTCVIYVDFRSLYPSIYYAYNIGPTTWVRKKEEGLKTIKTPIGEEFVDPSIRRGIIPEIVYNLIETRDKVKKEMKKETNPERKRILNAKQLALKYVANAFYGYTGYLRARFYVLEIANAITSCGRDILTKNRAFVEKELGYKVIYGDTDSFMVKTDTTDLEEAYRIGSEVVNAINEKFKGVIRVKIEAIFKTFLILTKKRYAGWMWEKTADGWKDKILMKGIETVRRDWCDLVGEMLNRVLEIILKEQNPNKALEYVRGIVEQLKKGEIPMEKLVIIKGISKPIHQYKGVQPHIELVKKMLKRDPASAPGVGDRVGFVIIKGTQMVSKRAEDPEYAKKHGLQIDSNYYLDNQVLPPLERVFEALGISKSELRNGGRQLGIFDVVKESFKPKIVDSIEDFEGFMCAKCNEVYRRIPLQGKCVRCGGELLFYRQNNLSSQVTFS